MTSEQLEIYEAAFDEGYAEGKQAGAREALQAMTHLTTMLNDRRTLEAVRLLARVFEQLEDEQGSAYWHTGEERC